MYRIGEPHGMVNSNWIRNNTYLNQSLALSAYSNCGVQRIDWAYAINGNHCDLRIYKYIANRALKTHGVRNPKTDSI